MSPHASTSASGNQSAPLQHARQVALQGAGQVANSVQADSYKQAQQLSPAQVSSLSDEALQAHIVACGAQMLDAERRYRETSCLSDAGERDSWWLAERIALIERGRRPQIVAAMEQARGLGPVAVEVQERAA